MSEQFIKTEAILGKDSTEKFKNAKVAIFGIGGVGGYVAEMAARLGIGYIDLFDKDTISESNLNRQIIALHSTIGKNKVDVMRERILDINPSCICNANKIFYLPENASLVDLTKYDVVIDAIDNVTAKLELAKRCQEKGIKIFSSMGTANKLNPMGFIASDIANTSVCPLAKVVRQNIKSGLDVVFSKEKPVKPLESTFLGSLPYVPPAAGLVLSKLLCNFIINMKKNDSFL